jgi:uncharacterized protein (DUF2336 family)
MSQESGDPMAPANSAQTTKPAGTGALAFANLDVSVRAVMAARLGERYGSHNDNETDIKVANELIAEILRDAALQVRQALVETLKQNPRAPREAILDLAHDEDAVAIPVLRYSEILTEDDILEILSATDSMGKMTAVAGREGLPVRVSEALCERGDAVVVSTLFDNGSATISERAFERAIDRVGKDDAVQMALTRRPAVPLAVLDRISVMLTERVRSQLVSQHGVSVDAAMSLMINVQQRITVGLSSGMDDDAVMRLMRDLYDNGRLTDALIIRALCMANIQFVEHALAVRGLIGVNKVREALWSRNPSHIHMILKGAALGEKWTAFVVQVLELLHASAFDMGKLELSAYKSRIIERILSVCADHDADFAAEDLDYLLNKAH